MVGNFGENDGIDLLSVEHKLNLVIRMLSIIGMYASANIGGFQIANFKILTKISTISYLAHW